MRNALRIGLLALLVALTMVGVGGSSLAAGDLFDDDYSDCPHKTRLRDGQISGLSVSRDSEDENHVNVAWAATDPATWGLEPNAYNTSLVVILDDGDLDTKVLSLGTRKTTFEGVDTGREVTVQMAIVTDTADGGYLISDILEKSILQSLTAPSFSGPWYRIRVGGGAVSVTLVYEPLLTASFSPDVRLKGLESTGPIPLTEEELAASEKKIADVLKAKDFQYDSERIANGMMYYIGYNENFANYTAGTTNPASYTHRPSTQRLRIGLAHSDKEDDGNRDDVNFDAYILRITDSDGDVVHEGNDVKTVPNNYGTAATRYDYDLDGDATTTNDRSKKTAYRKLFIDDLESDFSVPWARGVEFIVGTRKTSTALQNVRIVDGSDINVGMHLTGVRRNSGTTVDNGTVVNPKTVTPDSLSIVKVGVSAGPVTAEGHGDEVKTGEVYANPPDEYRDFPIDTLSSDVKYTITAWAINEDDEVISPVATLTVRPINKTVMLTNEPGKGLKDYWNPDTSGYGVTKGTLTVTEFTVIK